MSRLVARILLAVLMIPAAFAVCIVTGVFLDQLARSLDERIAFGIAVLVTWAFVAAWWVLLWRGTVRWTQVRITLTLVAVFAALLPAAAGFWAGSAVAPSFGAFFGGLMAVFSWLIATVFIWRETAGERKERLLASGRKVVLCPTCGYNLTGLHATRCPECGGSWTVDELMALQPPRQEQEL